MRSLRDVFLAGLALLLPALAFAVPPEITALFPSGGPRGETVTVKLQGKWDRWPLSFWTSAPEVQATAQKKAGEVELQIAPTAPPGVCWLRGYDDEGGTGLRPFFVGWLPEQRDQEPNNDPRKPQPLSGPAVVVQGQLSPAADVDIFEVSAAQGQTLIANLEARETFGGPLDPVLQILSADGFILAQNDDDQGFDPRLVFPVPTTGKYRVRVFSFAAVPSTSIRLAGGEDFVYRLTICTTGFVDHTFPWAISRSGPQTVSLVGSNIPDALQTLTLVPEAHDDLEKILFHPELANLAKIRWEPHPVTVEAEPNDAAESFQELLPPVTATGVIARPGDRDGFRFRAKKGDAYQIEVEGWALGSLLDPHLTVQDATGKSLNVVDDTKPGRDPSLLFRAAAEGEYRLLVRDAFLHGGPRYAYRLRMAAPQPGFELSLKSDRFLVAAGKTVEVPVAITRQPGTTGEIRIGAVDLPAGMTCAEVVALPKGDTAKGVKLILQAGPEPVSGTFRIVGRLDGPAPLVRAATAPVTGLSSSRAELWATVKKSP